MKYRTGKIYASLFEIGMTNNGFSKKILIKKKKNGFSKKRLVPKKGTCVCSVGNQALK